MVEAKATKQRVITGRVVSTSMQKTVVVESERHVRHDLYKKTMTRSNKVHAHDEKNECQVGDLVKVGEIKPMSKTKTWAVLEIVERAR